MKTVLGPMLGITDVDFRRCFFDHFSGYDAAVAPFVRINQNSEYKKSKFLELCPSRNVNHVVVPQLMANTPKTLLDGALALKEQFGYSELNWNLGCPSPTSAGRGMGCGLMPEVELIDQMLEQFHSLPDMSISIKTRLGYESKEDIFNLATVFNRYPLNEVVIHARTGVQGYAGSVDESCFNDASKELKSPVSFSGDVDSYERLTEIGERFPHLHAIYLARGSLKNPWLVDQSMTLDLCEKIRKMTAFLEELGEAYLERKIGQKQACLRVKTIFYYFAEYNDLDKKSIKKVRKSKSLAELLSIIRDIELP